MTAPTADPDGYKAQLMVAAKLGTTGNQAIRNSEAAAKSIGHGFAAIASATGHDDYYERKIAEGITELRRLRRLRARLLDDVFADRLPYNEPITAAHVEALPDAP